MIYYYAYLCWTVYKWSLTGTMQARLSMPNNLSGLVALIAFDLLFLSSLSFVRKRMYTLFVLIHITCVMVILYAVRHFFIFLLFLNTDQLSDVPTP